MAKRALILLACFLAVSGCASYMANRPGVGQDINDWVANQEYGKALDTIALIESDHPDYKQLKSAEPRIRRQALAWEKSLVTEAQQQIQNGEWYTAEQHYLDGLRKMPKSKSIRSARDSFLTKRDAHLAALHRELILTRGKALPSELAVLKKIHAIAPGNIKQHNEIQFKQEVLEETRKALIDCGYEALRQKQEKLAEQCYSAAYAIKADSRIKTTLDKLRRPRQPTQAAPKQQQTLPLAQQEKQRREDEQKRAEQVRAKKFAQELNELNKAYEIALARGDLIGARSNLQQLIRKQPKNTKTKQRLTQLDARIKRQIQAGLDQGSEYYTQGEYEKAKQVWENTLRLDPNNQDLRTNIARVDKVIEKLKNLKKSN